MARRRTEEGDELPPDNPFPDPDRPGRPRPGEPLTGRAEEIAEARFRWAEAVNYWQIGNEAAIAKRYANAEVAYEESQKAVIRYFEKFYTTSDRKFPFVPGMSTAEKINIVVNVLFDVRLFSNVLENPFFWLARKISRRREAITLEELQKLDWGAFYSAPSPGLPSAEDVLKTIRETETSGQSVVRQEALDYFALILATVFVPLARAEMNRIRRNFDAATEDYEHLLTPYQSSADAPLIWFTCDFIERPFILLALGETRLEKAEVQFKAASQGRADEARATYQSILKLFKDHGAYVSRIANAQKKLTDDAEQLPQLPPDRKEIALQVVAKEVTVPGIESNTKELPGLSQTKAPAESWLRLKDTVDGEVIAETNPRIYALLLNAQARLLQIEHGFNYFGYKDDYIPPWRFQFLLERARYFAEHAKNSQRDYLNFLNNAEREEFQEQNAAQAVEMEKANLAIETARVAQVGLEVAAAQQTKELAELTVIDAQRRLLAYKAFDAYADMEAEEALLGAKISAIAGGVSIDGLVLGALVSGLGEVKQVGAQLRTADAQREFEKTNLRLAHVEAFKAAAVARAQFEVAKQGLVVAGLQRQTALLRHEFAIQNLQYLRNRTLNAEQWFRLANAIRGVADTYLRYAVELAFLSEQAYEFEADKRINVIRFDYDQSEVGAYLAADFLLSDLDTIEQDFIVNQRQRQQQVRYVLSLAREFPAALEELRENGKVNFLLRLEQIEKRFPGLYNARIGMVDVLPVALMDSTRFSLDLTHTGSGQLRIKGQPDVRIGEQSDSVLNVNDLPLADYDWTKTPKELWPVKILVNEPETAVFSGLSRQDAASAFPVASSGQRNAFEGRALAGGWQIDMSARENQVVPGSLADLLITFTVSGYHDSGLRDAIDGAKPQTTAVTSFLSARQTFPDAFYDFSRTGRMLWKVPREMVASNGDLGRLRNIGMSLRPGVPDVHFSRLMTRLRMIFRVNESGGIASGVTVFTQLPETSVNQSAPLTLAVKARLDGATELAWDFGDGTPILRAAEGAHLYAKPGRYVLKLRCVRNDSLSEFRMSVLVSRNQKLGDPLIIWPRVSFDTPTKTIKITTGGAVQQAGRMLWRVGDLTAEGNTATFSLKPGHYTLDFAAVRKLNFLAYSAQRYIKESDPLQLQGFSAATNRTFDENGKETNGTGTPIPLPARNGLAKRLFSNGEISPEDDWTFELISEEILGLPAGTNIGAEELNLGEIQDVVLSMEYDITPGGP
jgi:Tc toxin complex TcA C-terminal TcB-binding domain/PKD domain